MTAPRFPKDAACTEDDADLFFPVDGESESRRNPSRMIWLRYAPARAICARCPIRVECARVALDYERQATGGYRYGMWGGLTPSERAVLARKTPDERARLLSRLAREVPSAPGAATESRGYAGRVAS